MLQQLVSLFASPSPLFVPENPLNSARSQSYIETLSSLFQCSEAAVRLLPGSVAAILLAAGTSSARVSEVLELTPAHYIGNHRFACGGSKHGRGFVVTMPVIIADVGWRTSPRRFEPFLTDSYRHVWRACRRAGIGASVGRTRNAAVTHIHRYTTAAAVNCALDAKNAGDVLHHASRRSISYYIS